MAKKSWQETPEPLDSEARLAVADLLREFDGRSVEPFREAEALLPAEPAVLRELAELAAEDEAALSVGATWILKARLESGVAASAELSAQLVELLLRTDEVDAQLHLLQTLPFLEIQGAARDALRSRLEGLLDATNTFVRAWAYNGFAVLGQTSADDRERALRLFERVPESEKASVRARIRHARKTLAG
ncbi:MAG: hypothetical protein AAGK22_06350 [Acidobacteriota bacterium]